jgi:glyoxylase-like metal-dependent hydrolase (beta-lactamase superfamily II)
MLHADVAPGIHRVEDAHTNWYLVEDGPRLTVVDAGHPASWRSLVAALRELGRSLSDIEALILTHAHFDHMGFARRAQQHLGIPVWAHEREVSVVEHPWHYDHERSRIPYLRHPKFAQILGEMTLMGALWVRGVAPARTFPATAGAALEVPGQPRVVFTPGHTHGHCSFHFPDRGAVIVGDAFVMLDPYTGRTGPCVVAGAATADSRQALASLDALAELEAAIALSGHGPPWNGGLADAVAAARAAGAA